MSAGRNGAGERRPVVLVGLMGAGKTCVGKRLARRLGLRFTDADDEIVQAAGRSIEEIFETMGEAVFRSGERRIIARLLDEGPCVLATGGGAFIDAETRARIKTSAVSVWLKADLDVLVRRTRGRPGRPLLKTADPRSTLADLMSARYPIYSEADIVVETSDESVDTTVERIVLALNDAGVVPTCEERSLP
ncbi:MAG: shikimate kinase [Rhodospirillales bacterium]|nr:shikimate kinase [Rhodospirillales bacterium]